MIKYPTISLLFLCWAMVLFSQEKSDSEMLLKRIDRAFQIIAEQPENAFRESKTIESEAQKINAPDAEMAAMVIQCIYYRGNNDFEKMMAKAELLFRKSKLYEVQAYEIMAKRYLFEAYFFSGLPEKAFEELEEGRELADRLKNEDSLNLVSKGDLYISLSNFYALEGDNKSQLKYLHLAGREFEKMHNREYRKKLLYIHYSNLAAAYNEIDKLDSAKYYIALSEGLNENFERTGTNITNLWVAGNVVMKEEDYEKALRYFKEAEKMEGYKNHLNIDKLYNNIILTYKQLGKLDSAQIYKIKRDSLKLRITENQNKSLHKLLKDKKEDRFPYRYLFILLFVLLMLILFVMWRKNKVLRQQEHESQKYLETISENQMVRNYTQLLQILEAGDPSFMNYFNEMFPDFSKKLLEINPQIIQSEIEFCSLLKLKIPTKEIARYKFITPKTVQNKKYLIRKKLSIPKEVDIYQWFDAF